MNDKVTRILSYRHVCNDTFYIHYEQEGYDVLVKLHIRERVVKTRNRKLRNFV